MKNADSHQLKILQTRRDKMEIEVKETLRLKHEHDRRYEEARNKLKQLDDQIVAFEAASSVPIVTEHALLRYLERAKGIDLADLRREILTERNIETINLLNSCKIPIGEGLSLIVRNRTIVSIAEK